MKYFTTLPAVLFTLLFSHMTFSNDDLMTTGKDGSFYMAEDGKVDPATFVGWSAYNHACVGCHGVGAVGTEAGADLTEVADKMSPEQFRLRVLHKNVLRFTSDDWRAMEQSMMEEIIKQEKRDSGELADMPRWEYNQFVQVHVNNIYRYLKARADGAIGPDKPGILK